MTETVEPARPGTGPRSAGGSNAGRDPGFAHVLGAAGGRVPGASVSIAFVAEADNEDPDHARRGVHA